MIVGPIGSECRDGYWLPTARLGARPRTPPRTASRGGIRETDRTRAILMYGTAAGKLGPIMPSIEPAIAVPSLIAGTARATMAKTSITGGIVYVRRLRRGQTTDGGD